MAIQRLVGYGGHDLAPVSARGVEVSADWSTLRSPENYTGYGRSERFSSPEGIAYDRPEHYSRPDRLGLNDWALNGEWAIGEQAATLETAAGSLVHRFHARDLNIVMGADAPVRFQVRVDGEAPGEAAGDDLDPEGYGTAGHRRLYQLLRQRGRIADRTAEITFLEPGVETYSMTFG